MYIKRILALIFKIKKSANIKKKKMLKNKHKNKKIQ